jgi:tRNA 2-thiocytidine biosynthesis protein TtcA
MRKEPGMVEVSVTKARVAGRASVERAVQGRIGRAMGAFSMLRPGDRVAVGVSGGKDSLCLLHALEACRQRAPFDYELIAVTIEQGKFTRPIESLAGICEQIGVRWVCREDPRTLGLVAEGVEHGCDVCSRHRRGALYAVASEFGATVLALGHTADDCAEALLRNVLFNGRIASLPPVAESRKGGIRVIRPLVYVTEAWTTAYVESLGLGPVGCVCQEKPGPRQEIRAFLGSMSRAYPDVRDSVMSALSNVTPYMLFDPDLGKRGADTPAFLEADPARGRRTPER